MNEILRNFVRLTDSLSHYLQRILWSVLYSVFWQVCSASPKLWHFIVIKLYAIITHSAMACYVCVTHNNNLQMAAKMPFTNITKKHEETERFGCHRCDMIVFPLQATSPGCWYAGRTDCMYDTIPRAYPETNGALQRRHVLAVFLSLLHSL